MEKLEGKIKKSVCISKRAFMLKCYPLCQHYAQFLIMPIMLMIMPEYKLRTWEFGSQLTSTLDITMKRLIAGAYYIYIMKNFIT